MYDKKTGNEGILTMPRRYHEESPELEPPRKKVPINLDLSFESDLKQGEVITDIAGKRWRLGKAIGIGGFGEIYLANEFTRDVKTDTNFVAKVERHTNGPLFVEINCYLRIGKKENIEEWKKQKKIQHLGLPHYVASGSHIYNDEKYRFLIIPRFKNDLDTIIKMKKMFNLKTVLTISSQIIDVLEYIHFHGYIHSDIKASNIMIRNESNVPTKRHQTTQIKSLDLRRPKRRHNLRQLEKKNYKDEIPYWNELRNIFEDGFVSKRCDSKSTVSEVKCDELYLIDYGLAAKYRLSNGQHRECCDDERKAHAGTLMFCSRDAHKGITSRRSDLESLGYNMIYWLTGSLPWAEATEEASLVETKKNKCFSQLNSFLNFCFNGDCPNFLLEYFSYCNKLQRQEEPDYQYCKKLFQNAIKEYGYKNDLKLDFDNLEGWGNKQKKCVRDRENKKKKFKEISLITRIPLQSNNIMFKRPKLRKKSKHNDSMMNWSRILTDPEEIIKQARERKNTEHSDPGLVNLTLDELKKLNPTYAMWDVYAKWKERPETSPKNRNDCYVVTNMEGFTPAMMNVYTRMKEREELEEEVINPKKSKRAPRLLGRNKATMVRKSPVRARSSSRLNNNNIHLKNIALVLKKDKMKAHQPSRRIYSLRG